MHFTRKSDDELTSAIKNSRERILLGKNEKKREENMV